MYLAIAAIAVTPLILAGTAILCLRGPRRSSGDIVTPYDTATVIPIQQYTALLPLGPAPDTAGYLHMPAFSSSYVASAYGFARDEAARGRAVVALQYLAEAASRDPSVLTAAAIDPAFRALHPLPRFRALIAAPAPARVA